MRTILIAVAILSLAAIASADTLNYSGETTDMTSYTGINADSIGPGGETVYLWDYVYSISNWTGFERALTWGIVCPIEPENIWQTGGWTSQWYSEIDASTWGTKLAELDGQPGIIWDSDGATAADYFHFQTTEGYSPVLQTYDGDGWSGETEYSANPEPGSLILSGLVIGFVLYRRRRHQSDEQA